MRRNASMRRTPGTFNKVTSKQVVEQTVKGTKRFRRNSWL